MIELSDDEVEELPQPMSRMEILNLIPNMAAQQTIVVNISRGYIPHSVKPQNNVYRYEVRKLKNLHQADRKLRQSGVGNGNASNNNQSNNTPLYNNASTSNNVRRSTYVATLNHNLATNVQNVFMQDYFSMGRGQYGRGQYGNFNTNFMYNSRMPFVYSQNSVWHHRNTMFQNILIQNHSAAILNRFMSVQMNNMIVPNLGNNMMRNVVTRNQSYDNLQPNNSISPRRMYHHRIEENMSIHSGVARNASLPEPRQRYWPRNHYRNQTNHSNRNDGVNQAAFKVLQGASCWSELKMKWREEKTITIDDEDIRRDEECDEIQVVGRLRSPLCGPKNAVSLEEVFSKLKIIKSMPEKTVRRKKSRYKISYNIYSNTQNYRKANPGPPLYRIVVIK